ncbi:hypothetical protein AAMO2058_001424800 [Amorphochlora amoebiformis]
MASTATEARGPSNDVKSDPLTAPPLPKNDRKPPESSLRSSGFSNKSRAGDLGSVSESSRGAKGGGDDKDLRDSAKGPGEGIRRGSGTGTGRLGSSIIEAMKELKKIKTKRQRSTLGTSVDPYASSSLPPALASHTFSYPSNTNSPTSPLENSDDQETINSRAGTSNTRGKKMNHQLRIATGANKTRSVSPGPEKSPTAGATSRDPQHIKGMRKLIKRLYKRNTSLLEEMTHLKAASANSPKYSTRNKSVASREIRDTVLPKVNSTYAKDHLIYIVHQRDRLINKLQAQIVDQKRTIGNLKSRLKTSVFLGSETSAPSTQINIKPLTPLPDTNTSRDRPRSRGKATGGNSVAGNAASVARGLRDRSLFSQFERLTKEYQKRVSRRLQVVRCLQGLSPEAASVLGQMERQLVHETCRRQLERAAYDARLHEFENAESCWFVDQKVLLSQIKELKSELNRRENIDAKIETQVYALLNRAEKLEKENKNLKEKLKKYKSSIPESEKKDKTVPQEATSNPTPPVTTDEKNAKTAASESAGKADANTANPSGKKEKTSKRK